jgi:hypothetical protein
MGAASPQILQAAATNEILTAVSLRFVPTTSTGVEETLQTITLTNATISEVRRYVDFTAGAGSSTVCRWRTYRSYFSGLRWRTCLEALPSRMTGPLGASATDRNGAIGVRDDLAPVACCADETGLRLSENACSRWAPMQLAEPLSRASSISRSGD